MKSKLPPKGSKEEAAEKVKELKEVLEVARAAVMDAIWCEDGLDSSAGQAVMEWITDLLGDGDTYEFRIEGESGQTQSFYLKALDYQNARIEKAITLARKQCRPNIKRIHKLEWVYTINEIKEALKGETK